VLGMQKDLVVASWPVGIRSDVARGCDGGACASSDWCVQCCAIALVVEMAVLPLTMWRHCAAFCCCCYYLCVAILYSGVFVRYYYCIRCLWGVCSVVFVPRCQAFAAFASCPCTCLLRVP
jgi:hypothetical protein